MSLHIKKRLELPPALENVNEKEKGVVIPDSPSDTTKSEGSSSSITPSYEKQSVKTKIVKNRPNQNNK